jgi:hypothetical protein
MRCPGPSGSKAATHARYTNRSTPLRLRL